MSFYLLHAQTHPISLQTQSPCMHKYSDITHRDLYTTVFPDLQMYFFLINLSKPIIYYYKMIIIKNTPADLRQPHGHKWNSNKVQHHSKLYMTHEPVDILSIAICHIKRTVQFFWTTKQPGWLFSDFGGKLCAGHKNRLWVVVQKQCIYEMLASICPITVLMY